MAILLNRSNQAICLIFSVAYIVLCYSLPVGIFANATIDDAHFWMQAESLTHGDWLGPYDKLTLAKGPTFPFFLAINYFLGLPVSLSMAILYVIASYLFTNSLKRIGLPEIIGTLLYVLILFEPALFPERVIRDDIYTSLTLLVFAFLIRLLFCGGRFTDAAILGFVLSLFLMTREEGVWIYPGMLILCVGAYFLKICKKPALLSLKKSCLLAGVFLLCTGAPILGVSLINLIKYDYFGVVDFKSPEFKNAVRALQSVVVGNPVPYVPVPEKSREAIYAVSPAFRELQHFFENEKKSWTEFGQNIYPGTENDYVGGWFVWAFRYAVENQGYYRTAKDADGYYERLTNEIRSAQKSGALPCVSTPFAFMPVLSVDNYRRIPWSFWDAILLTTYHKDFQIIPLPSREPLASLFKVRQFLGHPKSMPADSELNYSMDGWFYNKNHDWIDLVTVSGNDRTTREIPRNQSPDLVSFFKDPQASRDRFSLLVKDPRQSFIRLQGSGEQYCVQDLIENMGKKMDYGSSMILLGHVQPPQLCDPEAFKFVHQIKAALVVFYKYLTTAIALMGIFSLVFLVAMSNPGGFKSSRFTPLLVVVLALYCAYLSRIMVCVMVDISSFPAIFTLYLGTAYPLLPAASTAGTACLLRWLSLKKENPLV